ncbi:MAG: SRPBCC family protein [Noviherbaspirillum sp.]
MNDTNTEAAQEARPDPGSALSERPPGNEFVYDAQTRDSLSALSAGAGLVMLGLGIAQLLAPRRTSRSTGIDTHPALVCAAGALSIAGAVSIFSRARSSPAGLSRLASLALELSLLGRSASHAGSSGRRTRLALTGAAVAASAALDMSGMLKQGARQTMGERTTESGAQAVEKCITVNKSPEECYRFWRNFDRFPEFMAHLESVEKITDNRSHWKAKAPIGASVEWDAEISNDQPGELLAWHSLEGADVDNGGTVRFERAPGGRGTIVRVEMQYRPPGGKAGALVSKLIGENPSQQLDGDLRRFKQIIETGEITTTEGQTSGERSTMVKLMKKGVPG